MARTVVKLIDVLTMQVLRVMQNRREFSSLINEQFTILKTNFIKESNILNMHGAK